MKQIINGKIYNTETATEVACGDNGLNYGDCRRRTEELYITKNGNYFICNKNGNLIPISGDGKLAVEMPTIYDWIEQWHVANLDEREIRVFDIKEA